LNAYPYFRLYGGMFPIIYLAVLEQSSFDSLSGCPSRQEVPRAGAPVPAQAAGIYRQGQTAAS
jgi:hypothetical protein